MLNTWAMLNKTTRRMVMGRCDLSDVFHQFWMVFQPWQKIMNGMCSKKNTVNCVFSSGEKKDKRISQRPIHRFCGVQRSIIPMVPWFGWESMGIPWWLQREAALRAVLNGRVAVLWFLCDFSVCVFLWRILTLYKTKADKDFSAH